MAAFDPMWFPNRSNRQLRLLAYAWTAGRLLVLVVVTVRSREIGHCSLFALCDRIFAESTCPSSSDLLAGEQTRLSLPLRAPRFVCSY